MSHETPLRLYNTLTKRLEEFVPRDAANITFYTCGPTVYDDAHIGNFRSFLAADLLRRFIESPLCSLRTRNGGVHSGPRRVTHVMNITDVGHMTDDAEGGEQGEDRMAVAGRRIAEAKKSGKLPAGVDVNPADPYQIARFYEGRFREDARALGLKVSIEAEKDESLHPKATAHVPGMIKVIARLIERGHAYVVGSSGQRVVYFDVRSYEPYGGLSGNTLDALKEGEGGRISAQNQVGKKHPADFLLWKEDAGHIMKWESPWGAGYPGWHIECSVMSIRARQAGSEAAKQGDELQNLLLPDGEALIDLHSGGEDNIFPHHECEIAQSCCAFNAEPAKGSFASMWFHPRFLLVEGTKMSKSKGNFYTARDLFAKGIEPAAIRLELIRTHYRSNANFTMQGLADAARRLIRWRRYAKDIFKKAQSRHPYVGAWYAGTQLNPSPSEMMDQSRSLELFERTISNALCSDLNIAEAIAAMDSRYGAGVEQVDSIIDKALGTSPIDESIELPAAPMAVSDALECVKKGKDTKTYEWEWGLLNLIDNVLGVILVPSVKAASIGDVGVYAPGVAPDAAVEDLLLKRRDARAAKDFKASDAIRDQLAAMGYAIKDMAGGKVEVRRA